MTRALLCFSLSVLLAAPFFSQSGDKQAGFVITDVRPSRPSTNLFNTFARGPYISGERYELKTATLLDMIRIAYSAPGPRQLDADKVVGGPNWIDYDRFDIVAKMPQRTSPETTKLMLQSLLADRFKLKIHEDSTPLPAYALRIGKKPNLKEADGTEEPGCKIQQQSGAPGPGTIMFVVNGVTTTLNSGSMITYNCRNITLEAFAGGMRDMIFANVNNNRVVDETGLKGAWNFDIKFSLPVGPRGADAAEVVTFRDAVEKQLGLELAMTKVATPTLTIDSASATPTPNPAGVSEALPPLPEQFDVADVKPSAPDARGGKYQVLPSGRVDIQNQPLKTLIERAFDLWPPVGQDPVAGPKFIDTARFDIIAKAPVYGAPPDAPATGPQGANQYVDTDSINPMLKSLLIERFGMTFHTEERPMTAFTLTAVKSKLQKADPSHRTGCHEGPGADGKDPRIANPTVGRLLTCENMTMAQFAAMLPLNAGGYFGGVSSTIVDNTGLEGAFDLTVSFSGAGVVNGGGRGGNPSAGAADGTLAAADPNGISLFEALEKQLGLKLEQTKRPGPVLVIDHMEEKPKEP